jgi:antirestriction protein
MQLSQIKEALKQMGRKEFADLVERYSEEAIEAAMRLDIQLCDFEEAYQGCYDSDAAFVQQLLEDIGDISCNLAPYIYIDWERTAHYVMHDYCEYDGHYFRYL